MTGAGQVRGPWARVWIVGLLAAGAILGGLEWYWRTLGHRPSVVSDEALWSDHRARLAGAGRETVALLGGSRMQLGFVPSAFIEEVPGTRVVQLAVAGTGPFAALRDLAEDDSFRGTVLCSATARMLQPSRWRDQEGYVQFYSSSWGPGKKAGLLLSVELQKRLVILQPHLAAREVLRGLAGHSVPGVNYVVTFADRTRLADYSLVDTDRLVEVRLAKVRAELALDPPVDAATWRGVIETVAALVARLEARGGRIAFVRFPTRDRFQALEEEFFPRTRYWDPFAAGVGAVCIHHADLPGVEALVTPDESHLDYPDAIVFTRRLARELVARGVIEPVGGH